MEQNLTASAPNRQRTITRTREEEHLNVREDLKSSENKSETANVESDKQPPFEEINQVRILQEALLEVFA